MKSNESVYSYMKRKILWLSPYMPYDKVPHAGGKVHNYFIKYIKKNWNCEITLLTFAKKDELDKFDLNDYGIDFEYTIKDKNLATILIRKLFNFEAKCNPFQKFGGGVMNFDVHNFKRMIRNYHKTNKDKAPDFIIMQWTQAGLMIDYLKKIYAKSKYIIIEEDVSFQAIQRKAEAVTNPILKAFHQKRAIKFKYAELYALHLTDVVTVNNFKDKGLLLNENIDLRKIIQVVPYFDNRAALKLEKRNKNILFYGAMNRSENYLSAIWFIDNVFYKLEDPELRFVIIGGNPHKELLKYQSDRIRITGFVDDVGNYFKNSLCMAAPLLLGAGIKVKVLEALSAGLPVVTNEIGAEGIGIINNVHYLNCSTPDEYIKAINNLLKDADLQERIGKNGRQYILDNFDIDSKLDSLMNKMDILRLE